MHQRRHDPFWIACVLSQGLAGVHDVQMCDMEMCDISWGVRGELLEERCVEST